MDGKNTARAEIDVELVDLYHKAVKLEEAEKKTADLETALESAKGELAAVVEKAKFEVGQLVVVEFEMFVDFIGRLGERYDEGWVAAKKFVCHTHPTFNWDKTETAFSSGTHTRPLEGELFICREDMIANIYCSFLVKRAIPLNFLAVISWLLIYF